MVFGLEPAPDMVKEGASAGRASGGFPVEFIDLPGEEIPLDDNSVDTVLLTYTLCTIPDTLRAMQGGGSETGAANYCFEHGRAPDAAVEKWQNRLNGVWGRLPAAAISIRTSRR